MLLMPSRHSVTGCTGSLAASSQINLGFTIKNQSPVATPTPAGAPTPARVEVVLAADGAHSIFSDDPRPKRTISTLGTASITASAASISTPTR